MMMADTLQAPHLQAPSAPSASSSLCAGEALPAEVFHRIRRKMLLDGCKWDPQVGDVSTLSRFPLHLDFAEWKRLTDWAEKLSRELLRAETEVLRRPELLKTLSLPGPIRRVLQQEIPLTPSPVRIMRYDFHPTTTGWQISEVNSDVPGGYCESSQFAELMCAEVPGTRPLGNPGEMVADALAGALKPNPRIVLLTAPGYMEDHQVVTYLARGFQSRGCITYRAKPQQISWQNGVAHLISNRGQEPVDAVFRFHQAEWLADLRRKCGWEHYFRGGLTPVVNPGIGIIGESKRFPLIWDRLEAPMTTWRALLPETRDPREAPWRTDADWLVKAAFCNTGDAVFGLARPSLPEWRRTQWSVRFFPADWVAQRRFESVPLVTPEGERHVCVGVYTVNGRATGAYVRLAEKPFIDFAACDVALIGKEIRG